MTLGSGLMLIVGGALVLLVVAIGGVSLFIRHKNKIYKSIQEEDRKFWDKQYPGRFPR